MLEKQTWRIIHHAPQEGAWNMAVDEAILESVSEKSQPPTLRLYDWQPYCLSIGQAQKAGDVNLMALHQYGWDLVRRPTGGRAILHADELTYSVTAPIDNPILRGNVIESYRRISMALIEALGLMGLCTDSKPKKAEEIHLSKDPVCFQFPSDYEITFENRKIVGSAQARKKGGILQHGSIPLYGDITRINSVLNYSGEVERRSAADQLLNHATTLENSLGKTVTWSQMADAMEAGFTSALNVELIPGNLSTLELKTAAIIHNEKYNFKNWTFKY